MSDNNNEFDFDKLAENFGGATTSAASSATAEKLKEVNKKLPSWSLEPPMNFIK